MASEMVKNQAADTLLPFLRTVKSASAAAKGRSASYQEAVLTALSEIADELLTALSENTHGE